MSSYLKPYRTLPILDCGEPLIPIAIPSIVLVDPAPYAQLGADYGGKSPYQLRSGVVQALAQAQHALDQEAPGWKLQIFDAYRPLSVQQFMVDYTFEQLRQASNAVHPLNPSEQDELLAQVYQVWAMPSDDPATPPPHSTGAALDLTIVDDQGQAITMGGEIDELSPRSLPQYYAHSGDSLEQNYHRHRRLLNRVMETAGFLRHPEEWWHFSLGDQFWAWQYNQQHLENPVIARYGRVD